MVEDGLRHLRELTDPAALLAAAPERLGPGSPFERVVVHAVANGRLSTVAAWTRAGRPASRELLEALAQAATPLTPDLIETDLVRRRRAILVRDVSAQAPERQAPRLVAVMKWRGYVAAPLTIGPEVAALLHADRGPGTSCRAADRDLLRYLAAGAAQALERARLRRTLRRERAALRATLGWLDTRSRELAEAPMTLDLGAAEAARSLSDLLSMPAPGSVDTLVFDGVLTRRELEVLRLLVEGASNREIAAELVISLATAKFHVNRILSKLHAANRAEAVARYHALVLGPT